MKIVINKCYGGYGLSDEAVELYAQLKGITLYKDTCNKYFTSFYTVPVDEFNKVKEACKASNNYKESNELTFSYYRIPRSDPMLVQVVEQLGHKANSRLAQLKVVEIPDDIEWGIEEYDGMENVHEAHQIWE